MRTEKENLETLYRILGTSEQRSKVTNIVRSDIEKDRATNWYSGKKLNSLNSSI